MMHMTMPWVLVTLMILLLVVAAGAFLAVRTLAARGTRTDHGRAGRAGTDTHR